MKSLVLIPLVLIFAFTVSGQNAAFGILIDNTGSMRSQFERELELGKEAFKGLKPGISMSLFRFKSDRKTSTATMHIEVDCSVEFKAIAKAIDGLYTLPGQTALLDATQDAADFLSLKSEKCGEYTERKLVIITDGEDRVSKVSTESLISSLKKSNTRVFAIGLTAELFHERSYVSQSPREKAEKFLKRLTGETGGKVVFPRKDQPAEEIIKELFAVEAKPAK